MSTKLPVDFTTASTGESASPRCSCGAQPAQHCTCERAAIENETLGGKPTCSCGKRLVGQCTCAHKTSENKPVSGETCSCGLRSKGGKFILSSLFNLFIYIYIYCISVC